MTTARVWTTQCTLDEKVRLSDEDIVAILEESTHGIDNDVYIERAKEIISKVQTGKANDEELRGLGSTELSVVENIALGYLPKEEWIEEIGGSPAISGIADFEYFRNINEVFFAGNLVHPVHASLSRKNEKYDHIFEGNKQTHHNPRTLSLEAKSGRFKIMMPHSEGRTIRALCEVALREHLTDISRGNKYVFLGLGGLNKGEPEDYQGLIDRVHDCTDFTGVYIGTNSFGKYTPEKVTKYLQVCYKGDVISFNDAELFQVYRSVGGEKTRDLSEMMSELDQLATAAGIETNPNQIKVCHGASGALLYTTGEYAGLDQDELGNCLRLASDATSLRYKTGEYPCEGWARSWDFQDRQEEDFRHEFGNPENIDGMIHTVAPVIESAQGTTTGLGATFDGIMAGYLSKYVIDMKTGG